MKKYILFLFVFTAAFVSCSKKDAETPTPTPTPPVVVKTAPVVTTSAITIITPNTATAGGSISSDGNDAITERAIEYSTSNLPNALQNNIVVASTANPFFTTIPNLSPSTLYYVRAYAKNSIGIAYGNEVTFTTLAPAATLATVVTNDVIINSNTSATFGGSVTATGGAPITNTNLVISWNNEVTGAANQTVVGTSFTKTDCIPGTIYTVKFQATNSAGIANGVNKTGTTTGYHVWQDLGYATVYKTVNNANNCYFFGKVDLFSGVGNTTIAAGIAWQLYLSGTFTLCNALSMTNGKNNTLLIVNAISTGSVASVAYEYTASGAVPSGTFWCPAKDELVEVLQAIQTTNVPGVSNTFNGDPTWGRYWSSTELNKDIAWYATRAGVSGVNSSNDVKQTGGAVRPIGYK